MSTATENTPEKTPGAVKTLAGMGACYALGTFTDNFYKQAAILLAASTVMRDSMQSLATVLFSLPFILFSAWAGALADRAPKKYIVVGVKALELLALSIGGYMLVTENWPGMIAVMFCMGTQSTFFSPAINGSIPENFPAAHVPKANSLIKLASTAAILLGMALAGFTLDIRESSFGGLFSNLAIGWSVTGEEFGKLITAFVVVAVAACGLATAFIIKTRPASLPKETRPPFPWTGPIDSVKHALACRKDGALALVLIADAWFFGIAAIAVVSIANLGTDLGYSKSVTGAMTAVLMVGVAAGSLIAGRFNAESWKTLLIPAASGMASMLLLVAVTPLLPANGIINWQLCWFGAALFLTGTFGGLYLIPLESFIQVRPEAHMKGQVIAVSNFLSFVAMALFGALFKFIALLPSALTFTVYGAATFAFVLFVAGPKLRKLPASSLRDRTRSPLGSFLRCVLSLRYSVTEEGLDAIPAEPASRGILILPNHPALIDPLIVYSRLAGLMPRPLSDEAQMSGFVQRIAAKIIRAVTIPDMSKAGRGGAQDVRRGLDNIVKALENGDNVLLYPSGQLYRSSREVLGGKGAVAHILAEVPGVRVLLVRSKGLWGSRFSYAYGKAPQFISVLLRGIVAVFGNLLLFTPKRPVHITFTEPADLPQLVQAAKDGDKATVNRALETYYNEAETEPIYIPRFFWQKPEAALPEKLPRTKPLTAAKETERATEAQQADESVPAKVREGVYAILRERANLSEDAPLAPEQNLATDLFLDSLALMETLLALEERFGHTVPGPELLETVGDCLLAATGELRGPEEEIDPAPAPESWFVTNAVDSPLTLAKGNNFADTFFTLAAAAPNAILAADRSGVKTRKGLLIGILALAKRFETLPGERLGIMLPAVPAAVAVWLAAIYAGKEPVLVNWTVGRRNMEHCLALAQVNHIITASALLSQLSRTGVDLEGLPAELIPAEKLGASLSLGEKMRAAFLAALHCSPLPFSLKAKKVKETAAILFTSGSEAAPKAVPLTHNNIMTNAADVLAVLHVQENEKLLAMLPPFHSFGLLVGLGLPACTGIRTVYHPNPTESGALAGVIRDYGVTLTGATPTFMEGILAKAKGTKDLASLKHAFVGAEKCPDHVYRTFAAQCPEASLCEGYGITECSPVVAVNRPGNAVSGTIGHVLPSVTAVLVVEGDNGKTRRAATGETGMLLVRGPSIFSGYLPSMGETPPDPFVAFEDEKWYRTGDLLCMDDTGRLTFRGRLKRFVKIGGEMISLPQMEDVLQSAFAARPDLPQDGKPYIAVEAKKGSEDAGAAELIAFTTLPLSIETVNRALRHGGLSPVYSVRKVVRLDAIPILGTGKTDYRALSDWKE
ncbi:MAG: Bifunctional protein Aas [Desulfovibrio sp.]